MDNLNRAHRQELISAPLVTRWRGQAEAGMMGHAFAYVETVREHHGETKTGTMK